MLPFEGAAPHDPRIRIVLDHPNHHLARRAWRRISVLLGGVLVVIGLTASIPAVPASLAVVGLVLGWVTAEPPPPEVPVRVIVLVWAVTTPLAIGGLRAGLRLVRGNRTLILFLRRFGHDDAQNAVAFAVLQIIGGSWRVVTLDDAEMTPIGIPSGARHLFRAGHVTTKSLVTVGTFGLRTFPVVILAMWGLVAIDLVEPALEFARTGGTSFNEWMHVVEPYLEIMFSVFDGRLPWDRVALSLQGVFAGLAIIAVVSFAAMIAMMVAILVAIPLSTVLFFLSSSADAAREAERTKTVVATTTDDIRQAAHAIARRSRQVFGPRLVVLRVASGIWQHAVRQLVEISSMTLIDISEPTEHVLWELEELLTRQDGRFVLIGQHDRVTALASSDPGLTPVDRRLAALLYDREVLAYTTDRSGLRRFARALRGKLLEVNVAPPLRA